MNTLHPPGPCADYEHDLVELLDGTLEAERCPIVRRHVETCGRCRAWQAEFAALDARLAAALPRPALSADFERRLRERLVARAQPVVRPDLRDAADREHRQHLDAIRRSARRRALLDAIASAAVTACILVGTQDYLDRLGGLHEVLAGPQSATVLGGIGAAVALAALAWSVARGNVQLPGWPR
jgi:predicted anti-sigma-YlaC factor YlaD